MVKRWRKPSRATVDKILLTLSFAVLAGIAAYALIWGSPL
jgi:hypothetical protein